MKSGSLWRKRKDVMEFNEKEKASAVKQQALQALHDENKRLGLYEGVYAIEVLEQENRLLRARNERLEKELTKTINEEYRMMKTQQEQGEPDVSSKLKFDCEFVDGTVADLTVYGSERDIKRLEARIKFWWNLEQHSGTPDSDKGERIIWGKPPQQRTWVGLTDEEILELFGVKGSADSDINPLRLLADSRRIEAKLKEKNT